MLETPPQDKMMTTPPAKKEFHFAGGNIWKNLTILAENIEEATGIWHKTKQLINPSTSVAVPAEEPPEQSTPTPEPLPDENTVQ